MSFLVLLIDDSEQDLELFRQVLVRSGFSVATAIDADSGVGKASALKPDVILCDLKMPKRNGYWFVSQVKEDRNLRSIPVIAVTGDGNMFEDKTAALAAGFDGLLLKPMDMSDFGDQVRGLICSME